MIAYYQEQVKTSHQSEQSHADEAAETIGMPLLLYIELHQLESVEEYGKQPARELIPGQRSKEEIIQTGLRAMDFIGSQKTIRNSSTFQYLLRWKIFPAIVENCILLDIIISTKLKFYLQKENSLSLLIHF